MHGLPDGAELQIRRNILFKAGYVDGDRMIVEDE